MASLHKILLILSVFALGTLAVPSHKDELICHTSDSSDCYPRVFQATNEFRIIRDDQEIPKGLHIRMNLETGQKEAKLYDPSKDTDEVNAVEVVAQDAGTDHDAEAGVEEHARAILDGMKKASDAGSVKVPPASGGDAKVFQDNVASIKTFLTRKSCTPLDDATESAFFALEELCHDIYWGLQLVKDTAVISALYDDVSSMSNCRTEGSRSASLLGTALQNNKAALAEFYSHVVARGGLSQVYTSFIGNVSGSLVVEKGEGAVHQLYLISKLLQHDNFLTDFIRRNGLAKLEVGLAPVLGQKSNLVSKRYVDRYRRKAANLAGDYFIADDEARGRILSVHEPVAENGESRPKASATLQQVLISRSRWCDTLNVAYTIWTNHKDGAKSRADEKSRWQYVPRSCDKSRYDPATGLPLPGVDDNPHIEL